MLQTDLQEWLVKGTIRKAFPASSLLSIYDIPYQQSYLKLNKFCSKCYLLDTSAVLDKIDSGLWSKLRCIVLLKSHYHWTFPHLLNKLITQGALQIIHKSLLHLRCVPIIFLLHKYSLWKLVLMLLQWMGLNMKWQLFTSRKVNLSWLDFLPQLYRVCGDMWDSGGKRWCG